jgi:hypothetical protein
MQGTRGQVSFNEHGYPLNAYKTGDSGEAEYCFFKGKIFSDSLKKRKAYQLFIIIKAISKFRRRAKSEDVI